MNGEIKPLVTNMVTLMMLPNDLLLNCLARVSRLYYPTLSLVSKSFRSLLASLELYQTRTLLGRTESCLYVCLWLPDDSVRIHWYTLCRRPVQISDSKNRLFSTSCFSPFKYLISRIRKKENKLLSDHENVLVSVPTSKTKFVGYQSLATVGYHMYKVGITSKRNVSVLDCRSHTWHKAPSMQMSRHFPFVNVLDGKIYVTGGNKDCDSSNWIEFFDPKTQVWEYVQPPDADIQKSRIFKSVAIKGKLYLFGTRTMVYKPDENRWDEFESMDAYSSSGPSCVIDDIYYCFGPWEKLEWYDFEAGCWRVLTGLMKLPNLPKRYSCLRLVNYGGNLAVLWENEVGEEKEIWCAEISLTRRSNHEICGKIEWCNVILIVPESCDFLQFLSVTV